MVKVFSVFQFKLSVYFIKFDDQKWDAVRVFPGFAILVFINELNPLSLRDAAIFEIFLNFLETLLLKNFSILKFSPCIWLLPGYSQGCKSFLQMSLLKSL